MYKFIAIFIGGGLGAYIRYITGIYTSKICPCFPIGTLSVNVLGGFIMGLAYVLFMEKIHVSEELKLLLTVGFCGALTTFSAFALDIWNLFLEGNFTKGIIYIILNLVLTIAALALGVAVAKQF